MHERRLQQVPQRGGRTTLHAVGVHGGAGERTVAAAVSRQLPGRAVAAGHGWPIFGPSGTDLAPAPVPVVLVARTHMPGLLAAQDALREWMVSMRYVPLLGLVLIEDAPGKTPKPLREMKRLVASGAPQHWDIPYLNSLRLGGNALELNESALVGLGRSLGGALERHINL